MVITPYHRNRKELDKMAVNYIKLSRDEIHRKYNNIFNRCYNESWQDEWNPKYKGHTMSADLLDNKYETFFPFVENNYYEVPGEKTDLDHDIIDNTNTVYDLEHMLFAPHSINVLFEHLELGKTNIIYNSKKNTYTVKVYYEGDYITVADLDTYNQALDIYCNIKYGLILDKAERYKDMIPQKLYNIMLTTDVKKINEKFYIKDDVA